MHSSFIPCAFAQAKATFRKAVRKIVSALKVTKAFLRYILQ